MEASLNGREIAWPMVLMSAASRYVAFHDDVKR